MRRPDTTRYAFALARATTRGRRLGIALSVAFHLLLLALLLVPLRHDFQRVLDPGRRESLRAGGGGGGGGGKREAYISLPAPVATPRVNTEAVTPPERTPPPVPVTSAPVPEPVITPPVEEPQPVVAAVPQVTAPATGDSAAGAAGLGPGQGGGAGGGVGGGIGPGIGTGTGPGAGDSGSAGRGRAPRLRHQVIPPEDAPKELRGTVIQVLFQIDASGRVRRVTFDPKIPDGRYADRLREAMMGYRFYPALGSDGTPVPSTYPYSVTVY